ncbi:beta-1 adrenergic receptor-like [Clytia hemisphaerica]|uniref:beta-1 adrenergic receptor-like n=1 Tax=Clytia hemisphaerica TaxID=252671 RepID=UPI0034D66F37
MSDKPTENRYSEFKEEIAFLHAVVFLTLSFLITVGNIFVILALRRIKKVKHATKIFIFSLSIADLFVGCILIPLRLNEIFYADWTRTLKWCQLSVSVNILNLSASSLNLMIILIDRFIYVKSPLHYDEIVTPKRSIIVVSLLWTFVIMFSFLPIFSKLAIIPSAYRAEQDHLCKYATMLKQDYLYMMCFSDLVPLVVFGVLYYKIYRVASHQINEIKKQGRRALSTSQMKTLKSRERRMTRMICLLIIVFYCCWIPSILGGFFSIYDGELVTQSFIMVISVLVYSNSFFNCVIYYIYNDEFKKCFRKILHLDGGDSNGTEKMKSIKLRQRTLSKLRLGIRTPHARVLENQPPETSDLNNNTTQHENEVEDIQLHVMDIPKTQSYV